MTARLTLLCCGATASSRKGAFPLDEPLEAGAVQAAAALAARLRRPDRVWASPAARAMQTAQALSEEVRPVEALRDQDFGRWAGSTLAAVAKAEPEALAAWRGDPRAAPHGGESLAALVARVAPLLEEPAALRGHTLAVTHAAVVRAAVVHILAAPLAAFWTIDVAPLGAVELTGDGRRWALRLGGS